MCLRLYVVSDHCSAVHNSFTRSRWPSLHLTRFPLDPILQLTIGACPSFFDIHLRQRTLGAENNHHRNPWPPTMRIPWYRRTEVSPAGHEIRDMIQYCVGTVVNIVSGLRKQTSRDVSRLMRQCQIWRYRDARVGESIRGGGSHWTVRSSPLFAFCSRKRHHGGLRLFLGIPISRRKAVAAYRVYVGMILLQSIFRRIKERTARLQ